MSKGSDRRPSSVSREIFDANWDRAFSEPALKKVKFNGGRGALLCNKCNKIIATGFNHANKPHLCGECTLKEKTK